MDNILPWGDSLMNPFGIHPVSPDKTRRRLWQSIQRSIGGAGCMQSEVEAEQVCRLAAGMKWLDMIPTEWKDIYGALYEESQKFVIDEREKTNIEKDVHRTFGVFTRNRLLQIQFRLRVAHYDEALKAVLLAATHERKYTQGLNFLAALFILHDNDEHDSFILLCYLLKQRHLEVLFDSRYSSLLEYMKVFEKRLRRNNRSVYTYFKSVGFEPICYAIEWFTTCFIVSSPGSGELSSCVVDMLLMGFTDAMLRVGLAVLDLLEPFILTLELEVLQVQFKGLTRQLDPIAVIARALTLDFGHGPGSGPGGSSSALTSAGVGAGDFFVAIGGLSGLAGAALPSTSASSSSSSTAFPPPPGAPVRTSSGSGLRGKAVATRVCRGDILESMALNIDKMSPSAGGEFLDTMLDPLVGVDEEEAEYEEGGEGVAKEEQEGAREKGVDGVAPPDGRRRRNNSSRSRRSGAAGSSSSGNGAAPARDKAALRRTRHGDPGEDDGNEGDEDCNAFACEGSSGSDWSLPTTCTPSSSPATSAPHSLAPSPVFGCPESPLSASVGGQNHPYTGHTHPHTHTHTHTPVASSPKSPGVWLDGLVTVLSLGMIRSATKTSPTALEAGGRVGTGGDGQTAAAGERSMDGEEQEAWADESAGECDPAGPVRPRPRPDPPSPTSSDFADAADSHTHHLHRGPAASTATTAEASSSTPEDDEAYADPIGAGASSSGRPRALTHYLSERDRATERYRRSLTDVIAHLQRQRGETLDRGLGEHDSRLLEKSQAALRALGASRWGALSESDSEAGSDPDHHATLLLLATTQAAAKPRPAYAESESD